MTSTVASAADTTHSGDSQIRQQNSRNRQQLSPVMQKVRSLLPAVKPAQHLEILINEPLGNCQKLLCGQRRENSAQLTKLLRSWMGREVLVVLMGEAGPDWFCKYKKQLDVNDARRQLFESQRALEKLQAEIGQ